LTRLRRPFELSAGHADSEITRLDLTSKSAGDQPKD
jgi:hypothetical protein